MMQNADMTPSCDISRYSREAWLLLNHLTTTIGVQTIEETALIGKSKNISYKDLMQTLVKSKRQMYRRKTQHAKAWRAG